MKDRINKTSICSVVFIDIIDYSKKPVADQIAEKECFNALLTEAIKDVAQNDRIIIDTGDGAAIAFMGAPEEALFVTLTIRDGIVRKNKENGMHLLVRTGINLGPVRVVIDINGMPNIIGDGINVAQRIMTFAEPNQILVSRSYYEVTSRLTDEITRMFAYSGVKQDKHVREHEVYVIKPMTDETEAEAPAPADMAPPTGAQSAMTSLFRQRYLFPVAIVLFIGIVLAGVLLPGWLFSPDKADSSAQALDTATPAVQANSPVPASSAGSQQAQAKTDSQAKTASQSKKQTTAKTEAHRTKKSEQGTVAQTSKPASTSGNSSQKTATRDESTAKPVSTSTTSVAAKAEASWESFTKSVRQGSDSKSCSDGERALNQCH